MNRPLSAHIVLTGMMGSGKSTLGDHLAGILNVPFYDLDAMIESDVGMSIREIFEVSGETAFRSYEQQILKEIMTNKPYGVLAAGGGTVLSTENRRIMRSSGSIVWLYCRPSVLIHRLQNARRERPLLSRENWQAQLIEMYRQRYGAYLQCHVQLRNEGEDFPDSIREIVESLNL